MQHRVAALCLFAVASIPLHPAAAASLPEIKTSPSNSVPECATPGRLLAFLKSRNPNLDPRFESVPSQYMRQGEQLGVRWDFARNAAFKLQYDHSRAGDGSPGTLDHDTAQFRRGGRFDVWSATVDFVF